MWRWAYDMLYRVGAPWEMGARDELVEAVTSGALTAATLAPGRAIDLGCGTGSNAIFLAEQGFDVVGVDFSPVALKEARRRAALSTAAARVASYAETSAPFPSKAPTGRSISFLTGASSTIFLQPAGAPWPT